MFVKYIKKIKIIVYYYLNTTLYCLKVKVLDCLKRLQAEEKEKVFLRLLT